MRIRCKNCGTSYIVKDELITEKGLRVKCAKCGTTFIIRKRSVRRTFHVPQQKRAESEIKPEVLVELTRKASFFEEIRESSWSLRLFFLVSVCALLFLLGFSFLRYKKVRVVEKTVYSMVALKYGYVMDAIEGLKELVKSYPDSVVYNFLLARAYTVLGDERAKDFYRRTAMLVDDPGVKGSLLVRAGDLSEGIQLLEGQLLLSEDTASVANDLGVAFLLAGKRDRGISLLKDAGDVYPYEAVFNQGVFALHSSHNATRLFEKLYSMYPAKVEVLINTACFFARRKEYSKALQLLMMARGEHMYAPVVEHDIGIVYKLMGDDRYRAYRERDVIKDDRLHYVDYIYLLNPQVRMP